MYSISFALCISNNFGLMYFIDLKLEYYCVKADYKTIKV